MLPLIQRCPLCAEKHDDKIIVGGTSEQRTCPECGRQVHLLELQTMQSRVQEFSLAR